MGYTISAELQKELDQLDKFDAAYHNDKAIISDTAYDLFKDKVYKKLPPDHPRLDKVGHTPASSWFKEKHTMLMGSQDKVSSEEEIKEWVSSIQDSLGKKDLTFVLQHKIDGFSVSTRYNEGKLQAGLSRGNGTVGENITPNVKMFRDLPTIIPIDKEVSVRGEGYLSESDYNEIQKKTSEQYKNPRNAASGISRRYDGKFCKYIRVIAYDVNAKVSTEQEKIEVLNKLGFVTVTTYVCHTIEDILKIYRRIRDVERAKLPYPVDGLVLKLDDINLQEKMGYEHNRPKGQVALKFDPDQALTTVKDIVVQIGRTGRGVPVAILEPVDLMGSTISKATLHNFSYIASNGIGIGAEVTISRRGDIIPQVEDIVSPGEDYKKPTKCPSCDGKLVDDGVNLWCRNAGCRDREVARIAYWVETLDMKGFSGKFIEKLWDSGKIRSVGDIYKLVPDDLANIDGLGEKTVKNFFKTLESSSVMLLQKFVVALGIPSCSKSTADVLVERFKDWDTISKLTPDKLTGIYGFADISSATICSGISEVADMACDLLKVIKIKEQKKGVLTGMSFCVTGSLASMGRKEFQDLVAEHGGTAKSTVSDGLTYLVSNSVDSNSSKSRKAKQFGVKVISEDEFFKILGKAPQAKKDEAVTSTKKDDKKIVTISLFDE